MNDPASASRAVATVACVTCCGVLWTASGTAAGRQEIVAHCRAATALVDRGLDGSGSAFCVRDDGLFVTNAHVVAGAPPDQPFSLVVEPGGEQQRTVSARLVSIDEENDLALLQVQPAAQFTSLSLGAASDAVETTPTMMLGYPFGRLLSFAREGFPAVSVNLGRISALRRVGGMLKALQIDGAVNPGQSGGPVVTEDGAVIGVIVSGVPGSGVSFAIPAETLQGFLSRPGLVTPRVHCRYADRGRPLELEVEVVTFQPEQTPTAVRLSLQPDGAPAREIDLTLAGNRSTGPVTIDAEAPEHEQLLVVLRRGTDVRYVRVSDGPLQIGARAIRLIDVRRIDARPDVRIVSFVDGEKLAGTVSGWDAVAVQGGWPFPPNDADRIDVFLVDTPRTQVPYQLIALNGNEETARVDGVATFDAVPAGLQAGAVTDFLAAHTAWEQERARIESELVSTDPATLVARWEQVHRDSPPRWTVLEMSDSRTASGCRFERQDDGSYFVAGNTPDMETYVLRCRSPLPVSSITGLKLETLPDDRLPNRGPGRHVNGNYVVSELLLKAFGAAESDFVRGGQAVSFTRASADHSQGAEYGYDHFECFPVGAAIDGHRLLNGDRRKGWAIVPQNGIAHTAVFEVQEGLALDEQLTDLVIEMRSFFGSGHALGRFRLSVTDSPRPLVVEPLPPDVAAVVEVAPEKRTAEQRTALEKFFAATEMIPRRRAAALAAHAMREPMLPPEAYSNLLDPNLEWFDSIVVEARVPGKSTLWITRDGLYWEHDSGSKPGEPTDRGLFVLVNGAKWYPQWQRNSASVEEQDTSRPYFLPLGPAIWDYFVLSITNASDGLENPNRGRTDHRFEHEALVLTIDDQADGDGLYRLRFVRRHNPGEEGPR